MSRSTGGGGDVSRRAVAALFHAKTVLRRAVNLQQQASLLAAGVAIPDVPREREESYLRYHRESPTLSGTDGSFSDDTASDETTFISAARTRHLNVSPRRGYTESGTIAEMSYIQSHRDDAAPRFLEPLHSGSDVYSEPAASSFVIGEAAVDVPSASAAAVTDPPIRFTHHQPEEKYMWCLSCRLWAPLWHRCHVTSRSEEPHRPRALPVSDVTFGPLPLERRKLLAVTPLPLGYSEENCPPPMMRKTSPRRPGMARALSLLEQRQNKALSPPRDAARLSPPRSPPGRPVVGPSAHVRGPRNHTVSTSQPEPRSGKQRSGASPLSSQRRQCVWCHREAPPEHDVRCGARRVVCRRCFKTLSASQQADHRARCT